MYVFDTILPRLTTITFQLQNLNMKARIIYKIMPQKENLNTYTWSDQYKKVKLPSIILLPPFSYVAKFPLPK